VQWVAGAAVMVATAVILFGRLRRASRPGPGARARSTRTASSPCSLRADRRDRGHELFPEDGLELAVAQLTVMAGVPIAFVAAVLSGGFGADRGGSGLGALLGAEEGRPALRAALRQVLGDGLASTSSSGSPPIRRAGSTGGVEVEPAEIGPGALGRRGAARRALWSGRSSQRDPDRRP